MAVASEKLQIFENAVTFADAVCTITRDLPRDYFFLGNQLSRAATSIAANIADAGTLSGQVRPFQRIRKGSYYEASKEHDLPLVRP